MMFVKDDARCRAQTLRWISIGQEGVVDLNKLADLLGVKVIFSDVMPDAITGVTIRKSPTTPAKIYINSNKSRDEQRLALAQQIGHFVEREMVGASSRYSFQSPAEEYNLHEFYADQFAHELLSLN